MNMMKNLKTIMFVTTMCLVSVILPAQNFDYLQAAYDTLLKGDCQKALRYYNVYKEIEKKTDYELERKINDCFANKSTEGKDSWREKEVRSEVLIKTVSKKYTFRKPGENNMPSEREVYNRVLSDVKRDYPKRMIGIQESTGTTKGIYRGWWYQGNLRDDYTDYTCDQEFKIFEPNIRYYLNEAIRSANDGSRIALNQILFMEGTDESLENQLMDILFDEGFRVVNSISNSDYYINVKMNENSLQIRMVNAVTGEYEGVSTAKYDGFIDEIKIGKGGIIEDVEKSRIYNAIYRRPK